MNYTESALDSMTYMNDETSSRPIVAHMGPLYDTYRKVKCGLRGSRELDTESMQVDCNYMVVTGAVSARTGQLKSIGEIGSLVPPEALVQPLDLAAYALPVPLSGPDKQIRWAEQRHYMCAATEIDHEWQGWKETCFAF